MISSSSPKMFRWICLSRGNYGLVKRICSVVSNLTTLDALFFLSALLQALEVAKQEAFNADQGSLPEESLPIGWSERISASAWSVVAG